MDSEVIKEKIHTEPLLNDPRYITLLSVVVLIFTTLFLWCYSRRRSLRRAVLLAGLSDSGKTLLFVRLAYSQYRQTFTSMQENIEEYSLPNKTLKLVDLPGQERLRNKFFEQYKNTAKAIAFVVDSVSVQKDLRDVAEGIIIVYVSRVHHAFKAEDVVEYLHAKIGLNMRVDGWGPATGYLYTILADPTIHGNKTPVLILCNKQDQPMAKGSQLIKSLLEKEINLVRITKSNQLQSVDPSQPTNTVYLGKIGKDFEFAHLNQRLDFAESSANTGDDDNPTEIKALQDWISKL